MFIISTITPATMGVCKTPISQVAAVESTE